MNDYRQNISLEEIIVYCKKVCGANYVIVDSKQKIKYGNDHTSDLFFEADVVVKPNSTEQVASIVSFGNIYNIPITPRGGGSGVTGGALPIHGGILISLERLNKIISINAIDNYIIAEAGVVTNKLCSEVEKLNLCFPIPPSSSSYSFIGGNVAENSGSVKSCKYGSTANFVLNLEVVLPTGEIIWTGSNVVKNSTGFNLTQLFVGSEGLLGIITKIVYRLIPKLHEEVYMLVAFKNLHNACSAVISIKQSGINPSAVELIGNEALKLTSSYLNEKLPLIDEGINSHLLIILEEMKTKTLTDNIESLRLMLGEYAEGHIYVAYSSEEKKKLSKLRFSIGEAMTQNGKTYRDIDACVPLSRLLEHLSKVEMICYKYKIKLVYFGHAMDGNVHTMLLTEKNESFYECANIESAAREVYISAVKNGGVISGEHGIGMLQKEFMQIQFSDKQLSLMLSIKRLLDPNGILNLGKVF